MCIRDRAKTIQKYLGDGYEVIASMGHVRDLPKARLCVDVKDNFKPKYSIIKGKEKLVKELKEAAAHSDGVLLATDPDREGEAISWHLAYICLLYTSLKTVETYTLPEDRNLFSYVMEKHQRCERGNALTMAYLQQMFRYPTSFETALYASCLLYTSRCV